MRIYGVYTQMFKEYLKIITLLIEKFKPIWCCYFSLTYLINIPIFIENSIYIEIISFIIKYFLRLKAPSLEG